jgi:hypothetical protein
MYANDFMNTSFFLFGCTMSETGVSNSALSNGSLTMETADKSGPAKLRQARIERTGNPQNHSNNYASGDGFGYTGVDEDK